MKQEVSTTTFFTQTLSMLLKELSALEGMHKVIMMADSTHVQLQ